MNDILTFNVQSGILNRAVMRGQVRSQEEALSQALALLAAAMEVESDDYIIRMENSDGTKGKSILLRKKAQAEG